MHPADRLMMENEMTAAAVAGCLAHAARQRGGVLMADAAELHKLGNGPLWPRSALEMERVQLPHLARRAAHAGCTVRPLGGAARGVWHVQAAPLPKPAPRPVAALPVRAIQPRPVAPAPALTAAEYERVRRMAAAERHRAKWAAHDRAVQAERVREHAANLALLASAGRRAAA